ncbi:MAG: AAA family ATPase [Planctomycetes bacterium]|nr:AAA family ATPase [Planctomycetota bacterium]
MRIKKIELRNFRGFEEKTFLFADQFNELIGNNGTGKTALLEALAVVLGSYVRGMDQLYLRRYLDEHGERGGSPVYGIRQKDIRRRSFALGGATQIEPQFPASVTCTAKACGETISWERSLDVEEQEDARQKLEGGEALNSVLKPGGLTKVLDVLRGGVQNGSDVVLPLVAYYGTGRLWQSSRAFPPRSPGSRVLGYDWCLEPNADPRGFLQWFKAMELAVIQRQEAPEVLQAVKGALEECVQGWSGFYYDMEQDALLATGEGGDKLPFHMLSDGVRNMLAMVADLARRAAVLNPHLGAEAARATPGVVLVDELDLHLHPRWQRTVVGDLRRTFPELQFVCTTHSPFVVQQLRPGELLDLNELKGEEYQDKSIEDITEKVMGVPLPQLSERRKEMLAAAEEYFGLVKQGRAADAKEKNRLKERLDELIAPFSDDPAYQAFLKLERTAAGLGDQDR